MPDFLPGDLAQVTHLSTFWLETPRQVPYADVERQDILLVAGEVKDYFVLCFSTKHQRLGWISLRTLSRIAR